MNINEVRRQRDMMLAATDKYMIADWPISAEEKSAWQTYRQALRDITGLESFNSENDFWPLPPKRYILNDGSSINLPIDYTDQF